MNELKSIPIFYACDDNFVKYTIVSLRSLMANASREEHYTIHILCTDIGERMKKIVLDMADEQFEIRFEHVGNYLKSINERLPIRDYYSKTTYYRLFISEMFPQYDKAVYLDSDTIVLGDISELYYHNLGECYVGAANEQAMVQEDVYGTYVEKVLGIDRNRFFNAGVLLINCEQFRKNHVLDQFVELLHTYDFVVTQDEDYLNLICKDHVLWIAQQWNMEVFGEIRYPESSFQILHYIMVSKPWHYKDCRYAQYFWKYAKETKVYDQIQAVLDSYTDEERKEDHLSCLRLAQTARDEAVKENNYLNMLNSGRLKSKDRLKVLSRIAQLEREGRFDEDVEEDPPTKELQPEKIDYLRTKLSSRIKRKFAYQVARVYLNDLIENKKLIVKGIQGIEHFSSLDSGAVITCNHFSAMDSFIMQMTYEAANQKQRLLYRVIREGNYTNFPGFYGLLMRNCNTFPLSSNTSTMRKFMKSMDTVLQDGHFMLVYPEQSMWWNYRKPKPLKKGAYSFAAKNQVPVLPCFITMEDSDRLDEDGFYIQEYTVHVSEPIFPDPDKNKVQNVQAMMEANYKVWKDIYEKTYGIPLTYACEMRAE